MAVDKATKEQDELELYQIDDKAIVPFFQKHLEELRQFIHDHQCNDHLCLLVLPSVLCMTKSRTASRP